jgi:hypothetical protein
MSAIANDSSFGQGQSEDTHDLSAQDAGEFETERRIQKEPSKPCHPPREICDSFCRKSLIHAGVPPPFPANSPHLMRHFPRCHVQQRRAERQQQTGYSKGHGRCEKRTIKTTTALNELVARLGWSSV